MLTKLENLAKTISVNKSNEFMNIIIKPISSVIKIKIIKISWS